MGKHNVDIVGTEIGNWKVYEEAGLNRYGARLYKCICKNCGNDTIKTKAQMQRNASQKCAECPPNYHFIINGDVAEGTLPSGIKFQVDAEDVELVSKLWWRIHKGYVVSTPRKKGRIRLHRFLLNVPDDYYVDHINRNPLDCRKSNLRIVNNQQNSMNRSLLSHSTTGYTGVSFVTSKKRYRAQIGLNNFDIFLGSSKDAIECAQMYNVAAKFLFGAFVGNLNDVPVPSRELEERILSKLSSYENEAKMATQECGLFLCTES